MKKNSNLAVGILFTATLFLSGCNSINESDWVQTQQHDDTLKTLIQYSNTNESEQTERVEQVKTEFWPESPKHKMVKSTVTNVLDGNLIEINGESKLRLLGISTITSEKYKRIYRKIPPEPAIEYLKNNLLNKTVYIEQNPVFQINPDKEYVGYVWIGNELKLSNVNALLLENGLAITDRIENVTFYDKSFKTIENTARTNQLGLWQDKK